MISTASLQEGLASFAANNGLDKLNYLIMHGGADVCKIALWTLSNFACENYSTAELVIANDVFNSVIDKLEHTECDEIKREALFIAGHVLNLLPSHRIDEVLTQYGSLLPVYL